jgi:hypothetical protein
LLCDSDVVVGVGEDSVDVSFFLKSIEQPVDSFIDPGEGFTWMATTFFRLIVAERSADMAAAVLRVGS